MHEVRPEPSVTAREPVVRVTLKRNVGRAVWGTFRSPERDNTRTVPMWNRTAGHFGPAQAATGVSTDS